jgi:hypothetical protein
MIAHHRAEGRPIGKRRKRTAHEGHFPHVTNLKGVARDSRTGNDDGHHGRPIRMFEIVIPDEPEQRQDQQRQLDPIHKPNPAAEPEQ